jgi:hypothetical protein
MTKSTLLALIHSWIDGHCPNEVLLDAAIEAGYDVDRPRQAKARSLREHVTGDAVFTPCDATPIARSACLAVRHLKQFCAGEIW